MSCSYWALVEMVVSWIVTQKFHFITITIVLTINIKNFQCGSIPRSCHHSQIVLRYYYHSNNVLTSTMSDYWTHYHDVNSSELFTCCDVPVLALRWEAHRHVYHVCIASVSKSQTFTLYCMLLVMIIELILGWRVTFTANIYTPLDRGMFLLQLCRWKFSHKETL